MLLTLNRQSGHQGAAAKCGNRSERSRTGSTHIDLLTRVRDMVELVADKGYTHMPARS